MSIIKTPPMGWNSWDCYGAGVTEKIIKQNADYIAKNLKQYGWEYVVVDIQWSAPNAYTHAYDPFTELCMDEYSRLIPAENRFPSSAGGKGFAPLAEYVHSLGLKFGIHIMRGIPRQAVHRNTKILGSEHTAREIAKRASICEWNTDMYGVDPEQEGAREYYESLFALYAQWGVDFIKIDDICREMPHEKTELILISDCIRNCGRDMIFSLSPGPAVLDECETYKQTADMWRITDDFWDSWPLLKDMFRRCELWQGKNQPGCYPDCDMLPVGVIGGCFDKKVERQSALTVEEQRTMMSLWCIAGSPLMAGAELTKLDDFTLALLTNRDVLDMQRCGQYAMQLARTDEYAIWVSRDPAKDRGYIALFNLADEERAVHCWVGAIADRGYKPYDGGRIRELWTGAEAAFSSGGLACLVPAHGARVFVY